METKVIKIDPRDIKLLEVNARFMRAEEFQRLVENVKRDGCLTQLPFCCYNEEGQLEVLSGNHRVQAAIEAGLDEIDVQITEDKLNKNQRIGIQLSHNAISGQDDMSILKELYQAIDDIDYKAYSGLDDETLKILDKISTDGMSEGSLKFQVLNLAFLPSEVKDIKRVIDKVKKEIGKNVTLLMRFEEYDKFLDTLNDVSQGMRIKNTAVAFLGMLDIVENHLSDLKDYWYEEAKDKEQVPISSVLGRSSFRADDMRVLDKAVQRMRDLGMLNKDNEEKAISILAEQFLENNMTKKEKRKEERKKKGNVSDSEKRKR
jgi:ParB-like chromosome segregation protein Spo0J|nr:MAG TPA: ParB protein [Caudoviricetes sp.]